MSRVIFLLEERSMKVFLDDFLPLHFPDLKFLCIPHEGKNDLEKSIPRKLRAWQNPGDRFVIVRDNDGGDCKRLKSRLEELCSSGHPRDCLIRIACQELESWYLGDPQALADAFNDAKLEGLSRKKGYRAVDQVRYPSRKLEKLVPSFQKISGARLMAEHLVPQRNGSPSFRVFFTGIERLAAH